VGIVINQKNGGKMLNDDVLKKTTEEVWKLNGFELFKTCADKEIIEGGTVEATKLFDEDYLFDYRVALAAKMYEEKTGDKLEEVV
jgi:hypothetical protein